MMFLVPKFIKYYKSHSRNDVTKTLSTTDNSVFGYYAILSERAKVISAKQIESIKSSLRQRLKRRSKV